MSITANMGLMLQTAGLAPAAGGGGGAFAPSAVHFDSALSVAAITSALTTAGGAVADSPTMVWSFWARGIPAATARTGNGRAMLSGAPASFASTRQPVTLASFEGTLGHSIIFDNAGTGGAYGTARINTGNASSDGTANNANTANYAKLDAIQAHAEWQHYLVCFNGLAGSTTKRMAVYVDGAKQGSGGATTGSTAQYLINCSSALGFVLGNNSAADNGTSTFDLAEVYVNYGSDGGIDASNNVSSTVIGYFRDASGYPVDLSSNPLGTPQLYFSGDKTSFLVNKGAVTNSVTASNIFDASYGPGPVAANKVRYMGTYGETIPTTGTSITTVDAGINILTNDLIILFASIPDAVTLTDHNIQLPAGFTLGARSAPSANGFTSSVWGWKRAAADGESTAYSLTWTGVVSRTGQWSTTVLRGADLASPIDNATSAYYGAASNTTTFGAPAITPVASNCLLLTTVATYGNGAQTLTVPTGETRQYVSGITTGTSRLVHHFEYLTSNAAVAAKSVTSSTSDAATGFSITVKPA